MSNILVNITREAATSHKSTNMPETCAFQLKLVNQLRSGVLPYADAPIYTILLELAEEGDIEEMIIMLEEISDRVGKKDEFIEAINKIKTPI